MNGDKDSYLEDFVYGAVDGAVTTFAVVAGVAGASLASSIILILGFANLLGDGFSMSVGDYLSKRTRLQYIENLKKKESDKINQNDEGEKKKLKRLMAKRGFSGKATATNRASK